MRTGAMDRKIIIERKSIAPDSIGHPIETWTTLATIWAEVRPVSGREALGGGEGLGRMITNETAQFFAHYYAGITTKDRINYDSKTWNIRYLREIGRRAGLEMVGEVVQ